MDYQKSYLLMWIGIIAGFVLMLVGGSLTIKWLLVLGGAVFLAAILQTLLFFRCPCCGKLCRGQNGKRAPWRR